jgi:hypothetical protein
MISYQTQIPSPHDLEGSLTLQKSVGFDPRERSMCMFVFRRLSLFLLLILIQPLEAQDSQIYVSQARDHYSTATPVPAAAPTSVASFDEVIDRVVQQEHVLLAQIRTLHPMVETYLQNLKSDGHKDASPVSDQYFLGRLNMSDGPEDISFLADRSYVRSHLRKLGDIFAPHYEPQGFAQMIVPDNNLHKKDYRFNFVRREFLGAVRCLVIDVQPKTDVSRGRFLGRIWVEDQEYNIVRFNGTYSRASRNTFYLHFDSWRLNLKPGLWLPAYVYSEESDLPTRSGPAHVRAQTRLWGYGPKGSGGNRYQELTQIVVDSPQPIKDETGSAVDAMPVVAERMWAHQAEDNAVERLETIGLLAPPGNVDKVLQTVINNLLVTNNLEMQSHIRCRVLITTPLESFTIGRTIVISRGLLDVIPDEASLAMVLAHELSHILLGHYFDPKLAFSDRLLFPEEQSFQRLDFKHRRVDEETADVKALELLKNSPYGEKLGTVGLFLKELQHRAPNLPNLIRPHLGDGLAESRNIRMAALLTTSPLLDENRIDQIAALPVGGRIKLDPWTDQVELAKSQPVTLALSREKMPFEITPFFPYLMRLKNEGSDHTMLAGSGSK